MLQHIPVPGTSALLVVNPNGLPMTSLVAIARSNYFVVKDRAAFEADLAAYGIGNDIITTTAAEPGTEQIALLGRDESGWPDFDEDIIADRLELDYEFQGRDMVYIGADGKPVELPSKYDSIMALVGAHLADDQVAVFFEVAYEGMRSVSGISVAVDSEGETVIVDLDSIYELAFAQLSTDKLPGRAES